MWILAAILIVALMIPVVAILLDSPIGRSVARRLEGPADGVGAPGELRELRRKVEVLESEVEDLTRSMAGMRDEVQFMQRLLEAPPAPRQIKPNT